MLFLSGGLKNFSTLALRHKSVSPPEYSVDIDALTSVASDRKRILGAESFLF
jgi:hypothetical protein